VEPGPIEEKKAEDVEKEPIKLPEGFEWANIDMYKDEDAQEVYDLLDNHYVEDTGGSFRF
jgi:glycylpeptide N-tetradecanoyltransferase